MADLYQLLHRVRRRQGSADRLQLRHRTADGQVPAAGQQQGLILLASRYEGVDERLLDALVDHV